MAMAMTAPSKGLWNHTQATNPVIVAKRMPFRAPTRISLPITLKPLARVRSLVASARTATVIVWVPALPPIEATMGMRTARATISRIVPSKMPMTMDAITAVPRLMKSHQKRLRVVSITPLIEVGAGDTAKTEHILLRFLAQHVRHVVEGDGAQQPVVAIDDSHFGEPVLLEQPGNLFLVGIGLHGQGLALDERRQFPPDVRCESVLPAR